MLKFVYITSALLIASATPAFAQTTPTQDQTAAVDPAKSDVNKVVCKKEESIGSRLAAKKVCMTVKQWEEQAQASREETERVQQSAGTRPGG
jgi:hypothetical protein